MPHYVSDHELRFSINHDINYVVIGLCVKAAAIARACCNIRGDSFSITNEHALDGIAFCRRVSLELLDDIVQVLEVGQFGYPWVFFYRVCIVGRNHCTSISINYEEAFSPFILLNLAIGSLPKSIHPIHQPK